MKILHTADWHLGKFVNGFSMLEDQKYILKELINSLQNNLIEVLIISGDVFDRAIAPQDAVKLLDEIIYKIILDLNIKILIIPGNHDSAQRLSFASKLYREKGLYIFGDCNKKIPNITLFDEYGPVNFYLLPYFNPSQIISMFEDEQNTDKNEEHKIKTFSDAFKKIIEHNRPLINLNQRNILIAHGFFGYLNPENKIFYDQITSQSEVSVGGMDIIDLSVATFFDYIALGHLHAPQQIKNSCFRYSGSLLKYSVDEAKQKKSCVILNCKEKGNISINLESIKPLRDLRIVRGYMKDLCECVDSVNLISDDYVFVELLDEDAVFDVVPRLRQTFKNIIGVKMVNRFNTDNNITINNIKSIDFTSLFNEFYSNVSGQNISPKKQNIINSILSLINNE